MSDPLDERLTLIAQLATRRRMARFPEYVRRKPPNIPTSPLTRRRPRHLTSEQETAIAERLRRGETEKEVARIFQVSEGIPRRIRIELKIAYRGRPGRMIPAETKAQIRNAIATKQGTRMQIAAQFKVCLATVQQIKREMVST